MRQGATDATGAVVDDLRHRNEEIVRRFIGATPASDERRAIWAEDAVFELPLQGKIFRGREAILARGRESKKTYREFRYTDVVVYPMLDPNLFLVTHGSEEVLANGVTQRNRYAQIFELRDGSVVRRIEFHRLKD
jgi:ketosteroid isomerase-like protein